MKHIFEFKADLHHVYIKARKDPTQAWKSLWFIAINDVIDDIVDTWPAAWHGPLLEEHDKAAIWKKKEEAKCVAQQKWNVQLAAQVKVAWEAALTTVCKTRLGEKTSKKNKGIQKETTQPVTTVNRVPLILS